MTGEQQTEMDMIRDYPHYEVAPNHVHTYQKKPVMVEAIQWTGENANTERVMIWVRTLGGTIQWSHCPESDPVDELTIVTLERFMTVSIGDYIIRGVAGEFYPCKPDIFKQTYQVVPERPPKTP